MVELLKHSTLIGRRRVGAYFGASYIWNDYSLAPPVALHFWYDLIIGLSSMIADPDDGFVSARITVPW